MVGISHSSGSVGGAEAFSLQGECALNHGDALTHADTPLRVTEAEFMFMAF
jgi:hypothetical protein